MSMSVSMPLKHPGKVFLSVQEVAECLTDYHVFDVRYSLKSKDYGMQEYIKAHVPRATFANVDEHLSGPLTNTTARHPLPEPEVFIEWCRSKNINPAKPVLCYDDVCGAMGACRLWWMLHSLGVEVYVLNGGFQAYRAAGLPVESGPPEEKTLPPGGWPYDTTFRRAATVELIPPNAFLVDTRAEERYASTVRPLAVDKMPGHISHAVNLPWASCCLAGTAGDLRRLRANDECRSNILRALNGAWGRGEPNVSNCVFYCGSGVTAAFVVAVVLHVGLGEPLLYIGSWSEYAGRFAFDVARHAVQTHGMLLDMLSHNLDESPPAHLSNCVVLVDNELVEAPDTEVEAAVGHMRVGEKARVFFKSRRIAVIELLPRR